MITNAWLQPAHSHADTPLPEAALFHSTRGQLIAARPAAPSDAGMIGELLAGLSAQSLFLRYCMPMPRMGPEALARETTRLGQAHSTRRLTVVALAKVGDADHVVAVAELARCQQPNCRRDCAGSGRRPPARRDWQRAVRLPSGSSATTGLGRVARNGAGRERGGATHGRS